MKNQLAPERACGRCGTAFRPRMDQAKRGDGRFCSRSCAARGDTNRAKHIRPSHQPVPRVCQVCGAAFTAPKWKAEHGGGRTCSLSCSGRLAGRIFSDKRPAKARARLGEPYEMDGALVCEVRLASGETVLIDAEDAELVGAYLWHSSRAGHASTSVWDGSRLRTVLMHRLIMNPPSDRDVDHRNGSGLDNRKCNLRVVTHAENMQNLRAAPSGKTGVRGVSFRPERRTNPYVAVVRVKGVDHRVGGFATLEEADRAVREARKRLMTHAPECDEP